MRAMLHLVRSYMAWHEVFRATYAVGASAMWWPGPYLYSPVDSCTHGKFRYVSAHDIIHGTLSDDVTPVSSNQLLTYRNCGKRGVEPTEGHQNIRKFKTNN